MGAALAAQARVWEPRGNGTAEVISELCLQRPSELMKQFVGHSAVSFLFVVLVLAFWSP